jgi:DeoR/GlpR family transcriptional regulator of sugar metabolism
VIEIQYNDRQKRIIEIVKEHQPVTSEKISNFLNVNRSTIRPDLSILVMTGILDARPKVGYLYAGDQEDKVIANHIRNVKVSSDLAHKVNILVTKAL